jgi:uncharacterized membrane protein
MTAIAESVRRIGWRGRLVWVALALSLTLNVFFIGGLTWSKIEAGRMGTTAAERLAYLGQELNLSPDQVLAFQQFMRVVRLRGRLLHESNEPLLQRIWAEIAKPAPDGALISNLVEQANDNRHGFQKEAAIALMTFMKSLSPEQRAQFAELAKDHQDEAAKRLWLMISH